MDPTRVLATERFEHLSSELSPACDGPQVFSLQFGAASRHDLVSNGGVLTVRSIDELHPASILNRLVANSCVNGVRDRVSEVRVQSAESEAALQE